MERKSLIRKARNYGFQRRYPTNEEILQFFKKLRKIRRNLINTAKIYGFKPPFPNNVKLREFIAKAKYSVENLKITEDGRDIYIDFPSPNYVIRDIIKDFLTHISGPISINEIVFNSIPEILKYILILKKSNLPIKITKLFYDNTLLIQNNEQLSNITLPKYWNIEGFATKNDEFQFIDSDTDIEKLNDILNKTPYGEYPHLFRFIDEPQTQEFPVLFTGNMNCVYNICNQFQKLVKNKRMFEKRIKKIYSIDWKTENPGATVEHIEQFAKSAMITCVFYTELGRDIGKSYRIFNDGQERKRIKLLIRNGHCILMNSIANIGKVVYTVDFNIDDICYQGSDWCITIKNKIGTMYKKFRPSSLTSKKEDDENPDYFKITNMLSMFTYLFKKEYNIEPTQPNFSDHYKKCEKFIGRGRLEQNLPNDLYLYDHNRSYCSYKYSKHYIGFPDNKFYPRKGSPSLCHTSMTKDYKPSSVVCKSIKFRDSYVEKIYTINKGDKNYLTYPEYLFLLQYANIEVLETLYVKEYVDIDILGFVNQFNIDEPTKKFLTNASVGMLIAGGLKNTKKSKYYNLCPEDMEIMRYEALQNELVFREYKNTLKVIRPRKADFASFHLHSYMLSYSRIAIMEKMIELKNHVFGYTVDCLLVDLHNLPTSNIPGGWKYEEQNLKKILNYNNLSLHHSKNDEENDYISTAPEFDLSPVIIIDDIPGSSKTQTIRNNPNIYSILLEPSIVLRDKKTVQGLEVLTMEKYFQLNQTDKKRREIRKRRKIYTYVYVDEYLQFEVKQLKQMMEIAKEDGSIIIFLGDHCQIGGNNFKEIAKDTQIIYPKYDSSKKYRHSKEDIDKLSILRDKSITTQKNIIIDSDLFTKSNKKDITRKVLIENIPIASGNHKRISKLNRYFRKILIKENYNGNINVRDKDKNICSINIHSEEIWWNKKSRDDKSDLPYLPTFCETIDSIQGDTIDSIIVDINKLDSRYGCAYTAISRTIDLKKTIILV